MCELYIIKTFESLHVGRLIIYLFRGSDILVQLKLFNHCIFIIYPKLPLVLIEVEETSKANADYQKISQKAFVSTEGKKQRSKNK